MFEDILKLLEQIKVLQKSQEQRLAKMHEDIANISDKSIQEYLKNSIHLAQKGELNLDGFLEKSKIIINDANRDHNK
jgi:hypothetical protein